MIACCARIPSKGGYGSLITHACSRPGSIVSGGKRYCKIHDPAAVTIRRVARQKTRSDEYEVEKRLHERDAAFIKWKDECARFVEQFSRSFLNDAPLLKADAEAIMRRKPK